MKRKKTKHTEMTIDIQKNDYVKILEEQNNQLSARASAFLTMIMICPSTKKIVDMLKDNKQLTAEDIAELKTMFLNPIAFPDDEKNTEIVLNFIMQVKFHLPELNRIVACSEYLENVEII